MIRLMACAECRAGLEALGAVVDASPREGSLLDRCEAHTPPSVEIHAMHRLHVDPEALHMWRVSSAVSPSAAVAAVHPSEFPLVARLAAQLLTGNPGAAAVEIEQATNTARALLASAKGLGA